MSSLSNFGEQFASKVLGRVYANAVFPAIVNRDYEGEIKKPGDRVNILSFLNDILLSDYTVGSDMASETIVDAEDQLVVEKRKYYNFSLDKLEDLFTYASDIPSSLLENQSAVLERSIDGYVLDKFASETKAGNWIGIDLVVKSGVELGGTAGTCASIVTSATGGTITIQAYTAGGAHEDQIGTVTNDRDGVLYFAGFQAADLYKGIRLRSTAAFVTPWYRISGVTSSTVVTVTEWDEAVSGSDFEERMTLRGLYGGDGKHFPKHGTGDVADWTTYLGCGWEIQAAIPTAVTASTIYDQVTLLSEVLDDNEIPAEGRKLTGNASVKTQLLQAAETQPTGISEMYTGTVTNGKIMRFGGFDFHMAAGARISTRAGHSPASASTTYGPEVVLTAATTGYVFPANHTGFITFADKWSESRVVDAENQFAKKYQGLFLYGAKVPKGRRKYGAVLYGSL